jgi:2'-5' RNA ligase
LSASERDKSALVLLVPEAEPLVGEFRSRFDISAASGLPAHITILTPFAPPDSLSRNTMAELRALFAGHARFEFTLAGVCGFPSVVYLVPEPLGSFAALTHASAARFPGYPLYGGAFEDPVPHLTVAQYPLAEDLAAVSDCIVSRVGRSLPVHCRAHEVSLAVKRGGYWSVEERFALK